MGKSKGSRHREVHRYIGLPKRIETFQINSLILHLQELEEHQQRQPRAGRRKEITKIRAELSDIDIKAQL